MAERSFVEEVKKLRLAEGETFRGEGILAVTKALLQSGVSYVGGYQGAPVSHLIDVLVDAQDIMGELGVHLETCANEASAAAMLGASINYPLRGAVTWKSIVGTNVAADALSNLSSPGVVGGAMIIIGEDYGEGASVINISSVVTRITPPESAVYSGTKGAVDAITGVLARELGPRKIRVNAINPGIVITEGTQSAGIAGSDMENMVVAQTPLGRVGQPKDIATVAAFLASDDAAWLTGEIVTASGGLR